MQLNLDRTGLRAGSQTHLYPMSLAPAPGAMTAGATLAGKTSLMRIMAGLDRPRRPRAGRRRGRHGVPVRQRNVAMVYQQFINYPSMTVFETLPRRSLRGESGIAEKVMAMAARLHIDHLVKRHPSELSGGQQQRAWRARAGERAADPAGRAAGQPGLQAARRAARRTERAVRGRALDRDLCHHRARRGAAAGRLYGGARRRAAAAVRTHGASVPPPVLHPRGARFQRSSHEPVRCRAAAAASSCRAACAWTGPCGSRRHHRRAPARWTCEQPGHIALDSVVKLAEISGSDTFVHAETAAGEVVAQLPACTAARWTSACGCISIRRRPTPSAPTAPCWPRRAGWRRPPPGGPLMADRAGPLPFLCASSPGRRGLRCCR